MRNKVNAKDPASKQVTVIRGEMKPQLQVHKMKKDWTLKHKNKTELFQTYILKGQGV